MTSKSNLTRTGITLSLLALAVTGCSGPAKSAAPATPPAAQQTANTIISGKVVETMDGGGYTYVLLEKDGKRKWAAAPVIKVTVGQELRLLPGAEMTNFSSKALNRTFETIIFSAGVEPGPPPAPTVMTSTNDASEAILAGKVVETMNAMQYTYVKLEKDGKTSWAAVPSTPVKVGDEIELEPGTPMGKFTSKFLNKTFNSIYFASGLKNLSPQAAAPAEPAEKKAQAAPATLPASHPKVDMSAPKAPTPVPANKLLSGTVVETADAGGYTYICLEKDGQRSWAAIPPAKVTVGQNLALTPGVTMTNFVSKSMNRTFDKILFSNGIQPQ